MAKRSQDQINRDNHILHRTGNRATDAPTTPLSEAEQAAIDGITAANLADPNSKTNDAAVALIESET